jgi:hypothetical protein
MGSVLQASALFSLAIAEVHRLRLDDLERHRTLLLTILLGNSGARYRSCLLWCCSPVSAVWPRATGETIRAVLAQHAVRWREARRGSARPA